MGERQKTELSAVRAQKKITDGLAIDIRSKDMCKANLNKVNVLISRRIHLESEEGHLYRSIQKAKDAQARQIADMEQEQKLAKVMADLKRRELIEIKYNQLRQNNSHELRLLEKQLQTVSTKKYVMGQIKEKEALKKEEKEKLSDEYLRNKESRNVEHEMEKELQSRQNELKLDYKKAITEQIQENATKKQRLLSLNNCPFVIFESTGSSELQTNRVKTNCSQKEMDVFTKIKNELNETERKKSEKTNKRIEEYLMDIDNRNKKQEEFKNQKKVENDRIHKCLADNLTSLTSNTLKDREILNNLRHEQLRNYILLAENNDMKILQRNDMLKQCKMQLNIQKEKEKAEKEKDNAVVKKVLQHFQVIDKAEEKKKAERRKKMIDYGNDLKMVIDMKNDLRQKQKKDAMNEFSEAVKREAEINSSTCFSIKPFNY